MNPPASAHASVLPPQPPDPELPDLLARAGRGTAPAGFLERAPGFRAAAPRLSESRPQSVGGAGNPLARGDRPPAPQRRRRRISLAARTGAQIERRGYPAGRGAGIRADASTATRRRPSGALRRGGRPQRRDRGADLARFPDRLSGAG